MKTYRTIIVDIETFADDNKLCKNAKLYFVQDNKEVVLSYTSELDVIKMYNAEGYFVSAMDAHNRQFVMTKEIDLFDIMKIHPQTKGE